MTDIVSAITRFLTPELEKISSAAGLDCARGQKAIEAIVPTILSGLVELAGRPGGDWRLAGAVAVQPSDALSAFSSNLIDLPELEIRGSWVLSALLGECLVSKIARVLGNFTDIGERATRTLMDLLTPVIMGILGREQRASSLDAKGLARLLTHQSDKIAEAMPAGLADLLKTSQLYQEAVPRSFYSSRWSDEAPPRYATMQRAMSDSAPRDVSDGEWSAYALPVMVALGFIWWCFLLWWLLMPSSPPQVGEGPRASQTVATTASEASGAAFISRAADDWVSITGYFNRDIYNRSGEKLGTIEDVLIGSDGKLNAAVVAIDNHFGFGNKDIAVPFAALHLEWRGTGARLVFDTTRDALQNAPVFKARPASGR